MVSRSSAYFSLVRSRFLVGLSGVPKEVAGAGACRRGLLKHKCQGAMSKRVNISMQVQDESEFYTG